MLPSTVRRLERQCISGESIFERFPITVVSTDFIKSDRRRNEFLRTCPDLVIVDEAHTCVADGGFGGKARTQRYDLVRALAVFDPVWESLSPREQSRIVRLLIERVGYDGRDGRVTVTFRSPGVKALCSEADIRNREVSA